jgi:predicted dehydrogenase
LNQPDDEVSSEIRWGILGVARINGQVIPALRAARGSALRAVASRSPARAREAALRYGIPIAHLTYDALLADPEIDAVYLPLPNARHAEWIVRAARAGKHILCEKPLATSDSDAQAAIQACRTARVQLMEGFMWRHHPRTAKLREVIDSGVLGPLRTITGAFTVALDPSPDDIRLQPEQGGGALLDLGCYVVGCFHWLMGDAPVLRVSATATFGGGVDLRAAGWLDFGERGTALFDCGFAAPYRAHLEIVGTHGRVRVPNLWFPQGPRAAFELQRAGAGVEIVAVDEADQTIRMIEAFVGRLRGGAEEVYPLQAPAVLRSLDALAVSARQGRVVDLPRTPG